MKRIFVHGLGQKPSAWEETILRLGGGGETVCPDLPALVQGREVNYRRLYQAFSELCDEAGGSLELCGLSLGGVLALNYAIDHPESVRSLVLIAAQYKMPKGLLRIQDILFHFMPKTAFRQTGFARDDFIRLSRSMMDLDFSDSLGRIACPALILYGEQDSANRKASVELAERLKNAELQTLRGAGHEANLDAPEALAEALRSFYRRQNGDPRVS